MHHWRLFYLETCDAASQTEPETTLAEESEIQKKQDSKQTNGNNYLNEVSKIITFCLR